MVLIVETLLTELLNHKGRDVISVTPDASVKEAAQVMRKGHVGALLVMRGEEIRGILTERDILNKVVAEELDPAEVEARAIMTRKVIVIDPRRTVRDAMQVVTEKRLRHLPVVHDGHLVGVLSGGDLTRSIVAEEEGLINTLYDYIHGAYPG
jgi:CBS domain-containing protein